MTVTARCMLGTLMAEPRRISLISSTLPVMREPVATTSAAAAPSPKSEDVQFISLSFDVVQPTEDTLPAYDFAEQIYAAQKEIVEDNKVGHALGTKLNISLAQFVWLTLNVCRTTRSPVAFPSTWTMRKSWRIWLNILKQNT